MESAADPSASTSVPASSAQRQPRVGIGLFLVDDRGYILIGKRKGSHGAGTLALAGGHLDWLESWEECAARELYEETGIRLSDYQDHHSTADEDFGSRGASPSLNFVTAVNYRKGKVSLSDDSTPSSSQGDHDREAHYVTVFMGARIRRPAGQAEIEARIMEPTKCSGWVWVPLAYLYSQLEAQDALQRMEESAQKSGRESLTAGGVSLERLLEAQRLGERIHQSGSNIVDGDVDVAKGGQEQERQPQPFSRHSEPPSWREGGARTDRYQSRNDDEDEAAWALADDLAQGARLFEPLAQVLREREEVLRTALMLSKNSVESNAHQAQSPPASRPSHVQLQPNVLQDEATQIINDALAAPPHLKHTMEFFFPTPTPAHARDLVSILSVDRPLRPKDTRITYETVGAYGSTGIIPSAEAAPMTSSNASAAVPHGPRTGTPGVKVTLRASTVRILRLSANSICEDVSLVVRTMQSFPKNGGAGGVRLGGTKLSGAAAASIPKAEAGDVFEQGTVGKVETY